MYNPPRLSNIAQSRKVLAAFSGLNNMPVIGDSQFSAINNMTADYYPTLKTRDKRYRSQEYTDSENAPKLHVNRELIRLVPQSGEEYDKLIFGGKEVKEWQSKQLTRFSDLGEGATNNDISIASIGAYTVFMPYKAWLKATLNESGYEFECGKLAYEYEKGDEKVSLSLCFEDGKAVSKFSHGSTPPGDGIENEIYRRSGEWVAYRCVNAPNEWQQVKKVRYRISGVGVLPTYMSKGDMVDFGDFSYTYSNGNTSRDEPLSLFANKSVEVGELIDRGGYEYFDILAEPDGRIIISLENSIDKTIPITALKFAKKCPDMKYVCASSNRIWGCDYNGNEIYASAQGDIFNFSKYEGTSLDSWTATVGEGAKWTGCASLSGTPCFFKQDRVFVISGSRPSSYGYNEIALTGCVDNASIAVVNNTMFYMADDGVYAFSGGTPTKVSGEISGKWLSGEAGAWKGKYYLSREYAEGEYDLLIFDTARGIWHREDTRWYSCHAAPKRFYFITNDNDIFTLNSTEYSGYDFNGSGSKAEGDLSWYAETGDREASPSGNNYISRIDISVSIEGTCDVMIQYDGSGEWKYIATLEDTIRRDRLIKFAPRRCQYYRLRFEGMGETTLYSITETVEEAKEYV